MTEKNIRLADISIGKIEPSSDRREDFLDRLTDRTYDYRAKHVTQSLVPRHTAFGQAGPILYHRNYLEYLELCWAKHFGIVIAPDILWHIVLNELVSIVKASPDTYRHLFSGSSEKQTITILTGEQVVMPLDQLVEALKFRIPTDSSLFLPEFSTTTAASRHALYASFADLASPFYNYEMRLCGFPAISVRGTAEDWASLVAHWDDLKEVFKSPWMDNVSRVFAQCRDNLDKASWWREMFKLDHCGSGHETTVSGWVTSLFQETPSLRYVQNFPTNVAMVEYRQVDSERDFVMKDGLFSSVRHGDFMAPEFGSVVLEKLVIEPEPEHPDELWVFGAKAEGRMKARVSAL